MLSLTGIVADIGDQMMTSYWAQNSTCDCDPQEQLEDEKTLLVKAQSLPIFLKQYFRVRLAHLMRDFGHDA